MRPRPTALIAAERDRLQTAHRTPDRPAPLAPEPQVQGLLKRVSNSSGRALVEQAVLADAEAHDGSVSANRIRLVLKPGGEWLPGLKSQVVSATYSSLKSEGLVEVVGDERITGPHNGNNSGKTIYRRRLTARGFRVLRQAREDGAPTPWLDIDEPAAMDARAVDIDPHRAMPDDTDSDDDRLFDLMDGDE